MLWLESSALERTWKWSWPTELFMLQLKQITQNLLITISLWTDIWNRNLPNTQYERCCFRYLALFSNPPWQIDDNATGTSSWLCSYFPPIYLYTGPAKITVHYCNMFFQHIFNFILLSSLCSSIQIFWIKSCINLSQASVYHPCLTYIYLPPYNISGRL
jgi:hypothetical protein